MELGFNSSSPDQSQGSSPSPLPSAANEANTASMPAPAIATEPTQNDTNLPAEKPTWGDRVYHGILNALGGSDQVALQRDPQTGKMVATQVKSGPGQQWKQIISGALSGYSAGAGIRGPGAGAAKFGAGFNATKGEAQQRQQQARQQANEDFDMQLKAATSNAQNALLTHQITKSTFELGREQVQASAEDSNRENTFADLISQGGAGSQDLGVFPDFDSVVKAFKANPDLHDHQAGGRIVAIPHVNGDGKVDGVHAALVSPDWLNSKINQDLPITERTYQNGKLEESTYTIPAGTLTGDQYSKLVMSQSADALKAYTDAATQSREANRAMHENRASDATAAHENAETAMLNGANPGGGPTPAGGGAPTVVDMIGTGQMPVGRMAYLLSRNPGLANAVAQKYPAFDGSKIDAYTAAYKDFTSGDVSKKLNSGATALQHLQELLKLNTVESHIPGTGDYNAYMNKADTVSSELAQFYGTDTIPGIASIKKTLVATLPYMRKRGIQTQAQSMADKFGNYVQQWNNAAPSATYQARMPGISDNAIEALKSLDPDYDKSSVAQLEGLRARMSPAIQGARQPAPTQLPPQAVSQLKEGVNTTFANGQVWTLKNGQPAQVNNGQ
jgi:hypothetical protein